MKAIVGDIVNMEGTREAFRGVDCVMHCAALVSYRFPPDHEALDRVNVTGQIIIQYGLIATLRVNLLAYYND
jgi:nucleoside-diphosphate-sugar epimerase